MRVCVRVCALGVFGCVGGSQSVCSPVFCVFRGTNVCVPTVAASF